MALQYIKENVLPWMAPRKQRQSSVGEQVLKTASRQGSRQPLLPVANGTSGHPHGHNHSYGDIERDTQVWAPYETFPTSTADDSNSDHGSSKSSRFRVNPRIVSDAILGLSDGLTVPFAVSAGLSAFGDTKVVVLGSLAELVAGAISMGLGGYVGAKSEVESYEATKRETEDLIRTSPLETKTIVEEVFRPYNLPASPVSEMSANLHSYPERLMDFLLTFYHKQSEPDCNQAYISAVTLALGYFIGGFIPLIPYFCVRQVLTALYWSIGVMAVTLFAFGYIKTCIVRGWTGRENIMAGVKGGCQMFLVGGLAAGSAIALVRIIDHTAKT